MIGYLAASRAVVCASANRANEVVLLRTYGSVSAHNGYTIVDAMLATMAIPDWFNPVKIGSGDDASTFVGAPMKTHNPINEALKEIRFLYKGWSAGSIISIGNGHHKVHQLKASNKDALNTMLLKMMHDCDVTAQEVEDRFLQLSLYQRFSVLREMDGIDISDWNVKCFGNIATQTRSYIRMAEVSKDLDMAVKHLQGSIEYILPTVENISESNPICPYRTF